MVRFKGIILIVIITFFTGSSGGAGGPAPAGLRRRAGGANFGDFTCNFNHFHAFYDHSRGLELKLCSNGMACACGISPLHLLHHPLHVFVMHLAPE